MGQIRAACFSRPILTVGLAVLLAICSRPSALPPTPTANPYDVAVTAGQLTLQPGGEAQLAAQANDNAGQPLGGATFRYTAADSQVLRVTSQGRVMAVNVKLVASTVVRTSFRLKADR